MSLPRPLPVRRLLPAVLVPILVCLPGCAVVAVADAAVTVAATAVKVTAKTVGVVADMLIPDSEPAPAANSAATGSK
jgi:hypothetical protein